MIAVSRWAATVLMAMSTVVLADRRAAKEMAGGYGDKPALAVALTMGFEAHTTLVTPTQAAGPVATLQGAFTVTATDFRAKHGVVHIIDTALMP